MGTKRARGWSDIKWGKGEEAALAACKLGGPLGSLARYRERGEVPADFNRGRYRRKLAAQRFCRYTGMVRRGEERYFLYKPEGGRPTDVEMGISQEVWLNIFTDYRYEPRLWHPFVWVAYAVHLVRRGVKRAYVSALEWLFERAPEALFRGE